MTVLPGLRDTVMRGLLSRASPPAGSGRLSIAIFHRVRPEPDPLFPGEVTREHFDAVCGWLAAWFNVLPLDEAVERLTAGALPARALAITFDDGYADNHEIALPVLQAHGLCATFFVATGFLDGGRMWNDSVIESLRRCPGTSLDLAALGLAGIERVDLSTPDSRRHAIERLLAVIKYLTPEERRSAVDRIADRAGVPLPDDLMMRTDQVRALRAAGMQIGAHTVSHPILARLDDRAARDEIATSRAQLEAMLGERVALFAYPNGRPGRDFGPRDVALARELGFSAAVTTAPGAAGAHTADRHRLPRFTPWDTQPWRFGLRMWRNLLAAPA